MKSEIASFSVNKTKTNNMSTRFSFRASHLLSSFFQCPAWPIPASPQWITWRQGGYSMMLGGLPFSPSWLEFHIVAPINGQVLSNVKIGPFLKLRVSICAPGFPDSQGTVGNSSGNSFRKRNLLPHASQDQLSLSHSHLWPRTAGIS